MALELDEKDRRILRELDENSRQPISRIAKRTGLNREVVRYRIRRLQEKGFISGFVTLLNTSVMGIFSQKVYFSLHKIDEKEQNELIDYLVASDGLSRLIKTDGKFDLGFSLMLRGIPAVDRFFEKFFDRWGRYIGHREMAMVCYSKKFPRGYLVEKAEKHQRQPQKKSQPRSFKMDDLDFKILKIICENSRVPVVDVSRTVGGLSPESINRRIKQMEAEGLIDKYTIVLDPLVTDQMHFKLLVTVQRYPGIDKDIIDFCDSNSNVTFLSKMLGSWDYEIDLEVDDMRGFRALKNEFKRIFSPTLVSMTPLHVHKVHKWSCFPFSSIQLLRNSKPGVCDGR